MFVLRCVVQEGPYQVLISMKHALATCVHERDYKTSQLTDA